MVRFAKPVGLQLEPEVGGEVEELGGPTGRVRTVGEGGWPRGRRRRAHGHARVTRRRSRGREGEEGEGVRAGGSGTRPRPCLHRGRGEQVGAGGRCALARRARPAHGVAVRGWLGWGGNREEERREGGWAGRVGQAGGRSGPRPVAGFRVFQFLFIFHSVLFVSN